MGSVTGASSLSLLAILLLISPAISTPETFGACLWKKIASPITLSEILLTRNTSSYTTLLVDYIQNPLFSSPSISKPLYIIAPTNHTQVQASVVCARRSGLQIRVRSGGHDYEGLSYTSQEPFIVLDLNNLRSIDINLEDGSAWVEAGATLGELYYTISQASGVHGFPAGVCPTIGVGGHFSGGGIGLNMRKHGLSIDNILDAYIVDVRGRLLDRCSMGEEVFWAIRGGGAASFGVVVSWKIKLASVPPTVTVFTVARTLEQGAAALVQKWQTVAPNLPPEIVTRVILRAIPGAKQPTVLALFNSLFLGKRDDLLTIMGNSFPELGLKPEDCLEKSWIDSAVYLARHPNVESLLNREQTDRKPFKATSDFVKNPISEDGFKGLWELMVQDLNGLLIFEPLGGLISEIPPSATPFPHRKGYLYNIQYYVSWPEGAADAPSKHIEWIRKVYAYMTPYVTKSPRGAYLNYRDLDLGQNHGVNTTYGSAKVWGLKYFKHNFKRLALVKATFDRHNFFRHEQSIPPLFPTF